MTTPEEDRWFWQQNVNYATEIGRAIHEHVGEASPTTRALEPFKNRINCALESLGRWTGTRSTTSGPTG